YLTHFPAAGEVVIFDRSWYNRAGVEYVLGFCTRAQHDRFLEVCPLWEQQIVQGGIRLLKYWLEVGGEEQKRRFRARIDDPLRQWKLSPTDLESRRRWYDYSKARDRMLAATDTQDAPWYIVRSDDKRRARLNCIAQFLAQIPYHRMKRPRTEAPLRARALLSLPGRLAGARPAVTSRRPSPLGGNEQDPAPGAVGDVSGAFVGRDCVPRSLGGRHRARLGERPLGVEMHDRDRG